MKLKPCPKCGEVPVIIYRPTIDNYPDLYELLHDCVHTTLYISAVVIDTVIESWNERAENERPHS